MNTGSLGSHFRKDIFLCLLVMSFPFFGFSVTKAITDEVQTTSSKPVYGFVITEAGNRVEFNQTDFLWWAELDEEVDLMVDGKNFIWIERAGPIEMKGEKKDKRYIPALGHSRNGQEYKIMMPGSPSNVNSILERNLITFKRIEFLSDSPMGKRFIGPLKTDVETTSKRRLLLTSMTPDPVNRLEMPLGFTWDQMMERPVSKRVFMIKSDCTDIEAVYSKFHISVVHILVSHAKKIDGHWTVTLHPPYPVMTASYFPDLCGYTEMGWSRLKGKQIVKADFSGAMNLKIVQKSKEEKPGPKAIITDIDGKEVQVEDLRLRRVSYSGSGWNEKMEIGRLPNIVVNRLSDNQSQTIDFAKVEKFMVTDRKEPLKLNIRMKNTTNVHAECPSHTGEFEVLTLSGFSKFGNVEILLSDVREVRILGKVIGTKPKG